MIFDNLGNDISRWLLHGLGLFLYGHNWLAGFPWSTPPFTYYQGVEKNWDKSQKCIKSFSLCSYLSRQTVKPAELCRENAKVYLLPILNPDYGKVAILSAALKTYGTIGCTLNFPSVLDKI